MYNNPIQIIKHTSFGGKNLLDFFKGLYYVKVFDTNTWIALSVRLETLLFIFKFYNNCGADLFG